MFKFICLCSLLCMASAASLGKDENSATNSTLKREHIPLLRFESDKQEDGSFRFEFEGADKTFREEVGVIRDAGTEDEALEVSGSYRYIDADGHTVEVHYTAGKNGFVPVGTNILSEISDLAKAAKDLPKQTTTEKAPKESAAKANEKA